LFSVFGTKKIRLSGVSGQGGFRGKGTCSEPPVRAPGFMVALNGPQMMRFGVRRWNEKM
jgi:hypothetical protein